MGRKAKIIAALRAFAEQRAGMEPMNYGSWKDYRAESRSVTRDLHDARNLIRSIEWRDSITADAIIAACRAFSGRLTIIERQDGAVAVDYRTGQYFPTEYRKAVCAVCAAALWEWQRDHCMPPGSRQGADEGAMLYPNPNGKGFVSAGSWLRATLKREFGPRMQGRYFT